MFTAKEISTTSSVDIERETSIERSRARILWLAGLVISGLGGIGSGFSGLLLSFLVAEGVIPASSSVRLIVPILIVASLTLLMCAAHSLDRLSALRD